MLLDKGTEGRAAKTTNTQLIGNSLFYYYYSNDCNSGRYRLIRVCLLTGGKLEHFLAKEQKKQN